MSIQSEIDRIEQNVADTYAALSDLGADMPTPQNSDNLAQTVGTAKAVLYIEQTLTNEQQAQARENVGAASQIDLQELSNEMVDYLPKNQGSANVGKILVVGADGNLTLTDMPEGTSGDVIGVVDANNNIVITGDLADGTYVFKYENADGTYAEIGSLVVGGKEEYAITANLTNCTGSGDNATVIEEDGTATLTFTANDGYVLPETVTVSGAAYTWDTATGTLMLSEPTNDVVITIVAAKNGYTNIIDTVGYMDNIRLSSTDGVSEKDAPGYVLTNAFLIQAGQTVRTKGVDFNHATYPQSWLYLYNQDTGEFFAAKVPDTSGNGFTTSMDDSGNLTIIRNVGAGNVKIRLCGYGSGANLIVTINEEITN